jgi:putative membrane protein
MNAAHSIRIAAVGALAASACGVIALGAAPAGAAPTARLASSAQDQAFVTSNAQSNLAEIALGKLGEARGGDAGTKQLAEVTLSDHEKLETSLAGYAKTAGLTMPTAPNAMQQQTAATLMATPASAFDGAYAKAEVMGHQLAIATAKTEATAGSDTTIKAYATSYIPIATMHLQMAEAEVAALAGVSPTSVSAGTGGLAQTDVGGSDYWIVGVVAGAALVGTASGVEFRRRRAASASR